ncbi:MAG: SRPBCC family protein [Methyloligellaceae bacterium]
MKTLHSEIGVGAPAEIVWEVLTDLDGWQRWNPFMKASGALAPDGQLDVVLSAPGGKTIRVAPAIVSFDEGREFRWRVRQMLGLFSAEHGFRVVPEDVGRCRFEQFEVFSGLLAGAILSRNQAAIETGFQVMNRMLKRESERLARERA